MRKDPIVEEVHRARRQLAERFDHDLDAICADARQRERQGDRQVVSRRPKRPNRLATARARGR